MKKVIVFISVLVFIILLAVCGIFIYQKKMKKVEIVNKTANIVFTSDQKYKEYLKVTLRSAIENKAPDSIYNITILCVNLDDKDIEEYKKFETDGVIITTRKETLDSIKDIGNYAVSNHVPRTDLFKFIMPEIFSNYDKILYIDSDTIILRDLLEVYNVDLGDRYLGAVKKYSPDTKTFLFYRFKRYEYNCGVLLFNLKKMREDNITKKLIVSKNKDKERVLMTQTAFNSVIPTYKIKKMSPMYNFVTRWRPYHFKAKHFKRIYFPYLIGFKNLSEMAEFAVIAHFAGSEKPWKNPDLMFADKWWEYAKKVNPDWNLESDN